MSHILEVYMPVSQADCGGPDCQLVLSFFLSASPVHFSCDPTREQNEFTSEV